MSALKTKFAAMQVDFRKAIAAWPYLSTDECFMDEQKYDNFNNILTQSALQPIVDQHQLQILHEGVEHLLKHEGDDLPEGLEDALAAVMSGAIEGAECPLYAALLAIVRHRAQQAGRSL